MLASRYRSKATVLLVAVLMTASASLFALAAVPTAHSGAAPVAATSGASAASGAAPTAPKSPSAIAAGPTGNIAASMASSALAATQAAGLKPNVVFVPRPSASPSQQAAAASTGAVAPLYSGSPAPMGLAYFGESAGPHGAVVPTELNTTSLQATIDLNQTGVVANDLFQSSPDSYGIQLNAVETNITLFGHGGYSFWTQNVVEFYPDAHVIFLVTNVWNFSGGPLTRNVFYQHGPYGTQVGTEYYFAERALGGLAYPFNITLFMNSTLASGRDAVDFNVMFTLPGVGTFAFPYDYVVFNSTKMGGLPLTQPSSYTANGFSYNPIGLTDDFELIFGGPGGGSQATLFSADATLGLEYWDGIAYKSVPAAYSYGGETGETVTGANIAWSNDPAGSPAPGATTYGTMTTGPSVLTGLWNATAPEGSYPVTLHVTPANAFNVLATSIGWSPNFTVAELAVAPELTTHTLNLIPGNYTLLTELSDYAPTTTALDVTGPMTVTISLVHSAAFGIYTPLWAFTNSEVASLATAGAGTPASPYLIENNQIGPIGPEFGLYNDFTFPVYPGVFFVQTSVSVEFLHPASLSTSTNAFQFPGMYLPASNDLQYWFWNVSNVSIVGASNISGWFGENSYFPVVFDTFSVIFYEGGHNLVAGNTFDSEGQGLLMFSGGTFFGPLNLGGGNNTVWGNTFNTVAAPAAPETLMSVPQGLAMEIAESNDLIYNNLVNTPTTAWQLPLNLYTGNAEFFSDAWNISRQPAANVHFASGFPTVPLTGSILGTAYQGGNAWWDYGLAFNPYNGANDPWGVLPYEETTTTLIIFVYGPGIYHSSYIYPGGDYVPLLKGALYPVHVSETGLPHGVDWGANVVQGGTPRSLGNQSASTYTIYLKNGSYQYNGSAQAGWTWTGHAPVGLTISGAGASISLAFKLAKGAHKLTFHEKGLAKGTSWSVTLSGTTFATDAYNATETSNTTSIVFAVRAGTYNWSVAAVSGYIVAPDMGHTTIVGGNGAVHVVFTPYTYTVTFTETGLPLGAKWKVTIGKKTISSTSSTITFHLANGTYTFTVHGPKGETPTPASGGFSIAGSGTSEGVTFT